MRHEYSLRQAGDVDLRLSPVILVPARSALVLLKRSLLVTDLNLEQLGQLLLRSGRPPKVAFPHVVFYGLVHAAGGILGVGFPVRIGSVGARVCRIVGFVQFAWVGLDVGSAFKSQTGFLAYNVALSTLIVSEWR